MPAPGSIEDRRDFARALTSLREQAGLTIRQIAGQANDIGTHSTVGDWFAGRGLPSTSSRDLFVRVLHALGVTDPAEVSDWLAAWQRVRRAPGRRTSGPEPYRGLASFQPADAEWFFGREALTAQLAGRIAAAHDAGGGVELVVGASGVGKSSLLLAGLVPIFAAQWAVEVVVPGEPIPADRQLLVVDQFEVLFASQGDDANRYIAQLCAAADGGAVVVLGLRADFYGHALQHPELVSAARAHQLTVGPMTEDELRTAIVSPARRAQLDIEDGLVEVLLAEAAPGGLPLLSHALYATWRHSTGRRLTVGDYRAVGGIDRAVAASADEVYDALDAHQRELARELFLSLVYVAPDIADTRRRARTADLVTDDASEYVLDRFIAQRLITADHDTVRISHDAVLSAWPTLRGWLDTDRVGLVVRQRVAEAAAAWQQEGRDPAALYRGTRLTVALEWNGYGPLAADFLRASAERERADQRIARLRTNRLRRLVVVLVVLLLIASGAVAIAVRGQQTIRDQRDVALADKVAGEAGGLRLTDPPLAAQLGVAAYRLAPTVAARGALLSSTGNSYATRLTDHTNAVYATRFSPDGEVLATASLDRTVSLWDVTRPGRPARLATLSGHADGVTSVGFSHDGEIVATASADRTARLWDLRDPQHPVTLGTLAGHTDGLRSVAFAPRGRLVATASFDHTVRLWDVADPRRPRAVATLSGYQGGALAVFSPDGKTLATPSSDHLVWLWDVSDPRNPRRLPDLAGHTDRVLSATFSPDGTLLASGGFDNTVRIWDVRHPARATLISTSEGHDNGVAALAFSPDGRSLASGSYDRTVKLWNVGEPEAEPLTLSGHSGTVYALAYSPRGGTLVSGSGDYTARLWDLSQPIAAGHTGEVNALALSTNGRTVAEAGFGTTHLRTADSPHARRTVTGHRDVVSGVAFNRRGTVLATVSLDGTLCLWNPGTAALLAAVDLQAGNLFDVEFSPDGRTLAVAAESPGVRVLDVTDPKLPVPVTAVPGTGKGTYAVAFSPDGQLLAAGGGDHAVSVWADPRHPKLLATLTEPTNDVNAVAFSPDGQILAAASNDHTARLWSVRPARRLATLTGHTDGINGLAFNQNGTVLATVSSDRTARLWLLPDGAPLAVLTGHTDGVAAVVFGPDRTILTGGDDGTVRRWDIDPVRVKARICALGNPRLTQATWRHYFPDVGYTPVCA